MNLMLGIPIPLITLHIRIKLSLIKLSYLGWGESPTKISIGSQWNCSVNSFKRKAALMLA